MCVSSSLAFHLRQRQCPQECLPLRFDQASCANKSSFVLRIGFWFESDSVDDDRAICRAKVHTQNYSSFSVLSCTISRGSVFFAANFEPFRRKLHAIGTVRENSLTKGEKHGAMRLALIFQIIMQQASIVGFSIRCLVWMTGNTKRLCASMNAFIWNTV